MPQTLRLEFAGACYRVISPANDRRAIFEGVVGSNAWLAHRLAMGALATLASLSGGIAFPAAWKRGGPRPVAGRSGVNFLTPPFDGGRDTW